jgi:hypothetical protein
MDAATAELWVTVRSAQRLPNRLLHQDADLDAELSHFLTLQREPRFVVNPFTRRESSAKETTHRGTVFVGLVLPTGSEYPPRLTRFHVHARCLLSHLPDRSSFPHLRGCRQWNSRIKLPVVPDTS